MTKPLTQERVRELFDYDPETGVVTRKIAVSRSTRKGEVAGSLNKSLGYIIVSIDRKPMYIHRVIWLWLYGYLPEHNIDHINRDRADNRRCNLREATQQCNIRNGPKRSTNKSGIVGVYYYKSREKWKSEITVDYRNYCLGYYEELVEAVANRLAAEQALNWAGCDSNSSAFLYMQNYLKDIKCR